MCENPYVADETGEVVTNNATGPNWLARGTVDHPVEVRRFAHTDTSALADARRLRADVYRARGLFTDADLVDGIDACALDSRSIHVGLYDPTDALVGTVRVILGLPGQPIPVAEEPFYVKPTRPHGEISRYAVAPGWNGLGLVPAAWRELVRISEDHGLLDLYAEVEEFLLESLLAVGLPFEILGQPSWVYNAANYPVRLRMDTLIEDLIPRNPALAAFLCDAGQPRTSVFHPTHLRISQAELADFHEWWDRQRQEPAQ